MLPDGLHGWHGAACSAARAPASPASAHRPRALPTQQTTIAFHAAASAASDRNACAPRRARTRYTARAVASELLAGNRPAQPVRHHEPAQSIQPATMDRPASRAPQAAGVQPAAYSSIPSSSSWWSAVRTSRSDYHEDPGEEFFYQLEGTMTLRTMQDGGARRHSDSAKAKYCCCRRAFRIRRSASPTLSGWSSSASGGPRSRTASSGIAITASTRCMPSTCTSSDIEKQLPPIFERFYGSLQNRTCQACGTVAHKR